MIDILTSAMERFVQAGEMSGAACMVRKNGQEVYRHTWGWANLEDDQPVEFSTIYRLASMSKPITAIAVMQLEEEGRLGLDDPITRFLPAFQDQQVCATEFLPDGSYLPDADHPAGLNTAEVLATMKYVPAARPVTIRDLLSHSSGMGMGPAGQAYLQNSIDPRDRLADRVQKWSGMPLDFQPGERTGYSGIVGFDLLGRIVELASELDFESCLLARLWEPLGIRDIRFTLSAEQQARAARMYAAENGRQVYLPEGDELWAMVNPAPAGYFSGAAGLRGSVEAYDRITSLLANEGEWEGVRLLRKETVQRMHADGAAKHLEISPGYRWGLGVRIFHHPEAVGFAVAPGTYGWSGAYGTHMFIDPTRKLSATFGMCCSTIGGASSPIARTLETCVFSMFG